MRAESVEIGLGDDSLIKREENSTPMEDMEEVESTAEAGRDAEEFKSNNLLEEDDYQTREFQERSPRVETEVEENVDISTKIKKRNTIRNFPPPSEFHLSIRDEELLRPKNKRMQSCTTSDNFVTKSVNKSLLNDLLKKNNSPTPLRSSKYVQKPIQSSSSKINQISFGGSARTVIENIETDEGQITKNKPIVSSSM